jgi:hypothetical protein
VGTIALTAGVQTVTFTDGDPNVQIVGGSSKTFFVVIQMTSNASSQTPATFLLTHVTESSSTVEDAVADIALTPEFATNVASDITLAANTSSDFDSDGLLDIHETDTGSWTSSTDTGTDPMSADTDGDGLLDGVETNTGVFAGGTDTGTNPLDQDTDGDAYSDGAEVAAGTNPNDPASNPAGQIPTLGGLGAALLMLALLAAGRRVLRRR